MLKCMHWTLEVVHAQTHTSLTNTCFLGIRLHFSTPSKLSNNIHSMIPYSVMGDMYVRKHCNI